MFVFCASLFISEAETQTHLYEAKNSNDGLELHCAEKPTMNSLAIDYTLEITLKFFSKLGNSRN